VIQGHTFEKVRQFTYLGATISSNNDCSNRPTLKYGCEVWALTNRME